MIDAQLGYSRKTQDLIERMCRYVEREDFTLDKRKGEELILKTYDLFNLPRPTKVVWCVDIFDSKYQKAEEFARSARFAKSAGSAGSAWSALSAGSAGSDGSAGSAGSARSAWSARSAGSAGSAWSARFARFAKSAGSAGSAWFALDYEFDWFVVEHEYIENPSNAKPNEHDHKYLEYSELLIRALEAGVGYRVELEDTLYLVPTPVVRINPQNEFHNDSMPAIRWKGGNEFYFLNGVFFPKKIWQQVTSRKMPFQDILAIVDTDQRTQAMRYGNVWDFVKHANGELLDKHIKFRQDGTPIRYWLYRFPAGEIFTQDAYYAIYDDLVPNSDKQYMSGVLPCSTVAEAMAWKQSDEEYTLTPEVWKTLVVGVDMN